MWLFLAFYPKFLGGRKDLSFYECSLSGGDTHRWWGHSTLPAVNKFFFSLAASGDAKKRDLIIIIIILYLRLLVHGLHCYSVATCNVKLE